MVMEDPNKAPSLMWSTVQQGQESTTPAVLARRIRNAASNQSARARETPEGCALRRGQNAARMEMLRANESAERAAERRARNAMAMQAARARESPDQAAARRAQNAARMVAVRSRETPEQHAARKALNAKRMQAARAKEVLLSTHETSSVGMDCLMNDDVMRKAILATHRQPLKKRKDTEEQSVDLTCNSDPEGRTVLENREGSSKFTFRVN